MRALKVVGAAAAASLGSAAFAHELADRFDPLAAWTWDAWTVAPALLAAVLFAVGWLRLGARSRSDPARRQRRAVLFAAGWLVATGAVVSPLHAAGEQSFAAHMLEHELLMLVAAPLLVLAEPLVVLLWAFPVAVRRRLGAVVVARPVAASWARLTDPVFATVVQAAVLWLWHAPALFDLALSDEGWHAAQHLAFFIGALLFWSAMLRDHRAGRAGRNGVAALCLFATSVVSGALGALMAFSGSPWYRGYAQLGVAPFGLTSAEDQQLAGLLMWIPGGLVHAVVALVLVRGLLQTDSRGEERPDAV